MIAHSGVIMKKIKTFIENHDVADKLIVVLGLIGIIAVYGLAALGD